MRNYLSNLSRGCRATHIRENHVEMPISTARSISHLVEEGFYREAMSEVWIFPPLLLLLAPFKINFISCYVVCLFFFLLLVCTLEAFQEFIEDGNSIIELEVYPVVRILVL